MNLHLQLRAYSIGWPGPVLLAQKRQQPRAIVALARLYTQSSPYQEDWVDTNHHPTPAAAADAAEAADADQRKARRG